MNQPTHYPVVAFQTTKQNKKALINYTKETGRSVKSVMNDLLIEFLDKPLLTTRQKTIRFRTKTKTK